jgi:porin
MVRLRIRLLCAGALGWAVLAAPAMAQTAASPSPVQVNLLYTGELWSNVAGGVRRGTTYMQNADVQLRVDTEAAFGWTGGRFWLEGYYENRASLGNHYVGAVDQQSPIDSAGYEMFRLYQLYYEQDFGKTNILFGIYDLETEFSTTKPMSLFLSKNLTWNTALDQSGTMPQNGTVGPGNYPYTPLAVRVRQTLGNGWSVQGVIADGVSDNPKRQASNGINISSNGGLLAMAEVDYEPSKTTKLMAGAWALTAKLPTNDMLTPAGTPRQVYGQQGGYIGGATRLYQGEGRRGLDGFLTLGVSTPESTNTSQSVNGGLVYTGLLEARPRDKLGISFNENIAPSSYRTAQLAQGKGFRNYETSLEITYRAKINDWLTVQPDLQYIIHPGYNPRYKDDLVIGVHFEIGHLFDLKLD